ncbi:putative Apple domain-containing protein [Seiridium unicorne]|uniref:Apple domain-containing protein n=1 Tax=Seiridium unicorne TaxID=138068 RepID=A0ABR2VA26_9PEZI
MMHKLARFLAFESFSKAHGSSFLDAGTSGLTQFYINSSKSSTRSMTSNDQHRPGAQPGLEVVPDSGLQVAPPAGLEPTSAWRNSHSIYEGRNEKFSVLFQAPDGLKGGNRCATSIIPNGYATQGPLIAPDVDWRRSHYDESPRKTRAGGAISLTCGSRKTIILIGVVVLIVLALAVGLGVGLATRHSTNASERGSVPSTSDNTTTGLSCPGSNATYTSSSGIVFLVVCGIDYNSSGGSVDLFSNNTKTPEHCFNNCARNSSCVGAGYGWNTATSSNYCYMKSNLSTPGSAISNWVFGIAQS